MPRCIFRLIGVVTVFSLAIPAVAALAAEADQGGIPTAAPPVKSPGAPPEKPAVKRSASGFIPTTSSTWT